MTSLTDKNSVISPRFATEILASLTRQQIRLPKNEIEPLLDSMSKGISLFNPTDCLFALASLPKLNKPKEKINKVLELVIARVNFTLGKFDHKQLKLLKGLAKEHEVLQNKFPELNVVTPKQTNK